MGRGFQGEAGREDGVGVVVPEGDEQIRIYRRSVRRCERAMGNAVEVAVRDGEGG